MTSGKAVFLSTLVLALSACGSGGGGGPAAPLVDPVAGSCGVAGATVDTFAQSKVQIDSPPDQNLNDGRLHPAGTSDRIMKAGTALTAVMKDSCLLEDGSVDPVEAGDISQTLNTENVLPSLAGQQNYNWTVPEDMTIEEIERLAEDDGCLIGISTDSVAYPTSLPNDPQYEEQGHLQFLEANKAYEEFYGSMGITKSSVIAIIDTGMDMKHEDLRGVLWVNKNEIPSNGRDDDKNGYVDDVNGYNFASRIGNPGIQGRWSGIHHGTHVAGLAAAQGFNSKGISGVMGYGAKLMVLNVFGQSGGAYASNTANAIRYAVDNGAHVINLSLGGMSRSAAYESAIRYAVRKGVVVVAAAGNERRRLGPDFFMTPGAYGREIDGMITIGSVDSANGDLSTFTNFSPDFVELAAPGAERSSSYYGVLSTMPGNRYARIQGTSMAAPVASGAVALASAVLRTRGYRPSPAEIEKILTESALTRTDLTGRVKGGRVLNLRMLASYIDVKYPESGPSKPRTGSLPPIADESRGPGQSADSCLP